MSSAEVYQDSIYSAHQKLPLVLLGVCLATATSLPQVALHPTQRQQTTFVIIQPIFAKGLKNEQIIRLQTANRHSQTDRLFYQTHNLDVVLIQNGQKQFASRASLPELSQHELAHLAHSFLRLTLQHSRVLFLMQ